MLKPTLATLREFRTCICSLSKDTSCCSCYSVNIRCNALDGIKENSLQEGYFSSFQHLILLESSSRLAAFLISKGTMFHTFPAKYFKDFKLCVTLLTECNEKYVCEQRP